MIGLRLLLGGDYKQGRDHLRPTDDTYCCLGVGADIHNHENWFTDVTTGGWRYSGNGESSDIDFTGELRKYYGIHEDQPFQKSLISHRSWERKFGIFFLGVPYHSHDEYSGTKHWSFAVFE